MGNIVNKEAPDYLYELVPPLVAANVNYNLRNSHNIHVPLHRLSVYLNSYFSRGSLYENFAKKV
jgi:hypothetical protein